MTEQITISKADLIDLVMWACSQHRRWYGSDLPDLLQQAISEAPSTEALLDLYFTTDFTIDEAAVAAFEKRFRELEPEAETAPETKL